MEIDTGASRSIISEEVYKKHFKKFPLDCCKVRLKCYNGGEVLVMGSIMVPVQYGKVKLDLELIVVKGEQPCLLGRDWLQKNWKIGLEDHL